MSALSRSDTPQGQTLVDGRTQDLVAKGELPRLVKNPAAYFLEYRDGLKATLLMLNGAVKDFTFAARVKGAGVQSTQFFLSPELTSRFDGQKRLETPHLDVRYRAPQQSQHSRT